MTTSDNERESIGTWDLGRGRSGLGRLLLALITRFAHGLSSVVRWSLGNIAFTATLLVGGSMAVLLTYATGEIYESVDSGEGVAGLDRPVLDAMVEARNPVRAEWATRFTDVGGVIGMPVLAAVVVLALALWWRRRTPVILMLAAATGSLLMTVTGKELTARTRPPMELALRPFESSPSFPSGHTLNATVVAGVVAYLLLIRLRGHHGRRLVVVLTALFVIAMGLSRVYLGHHWLSDVVAAWLIGLGWLAVVVTAHRLLITLGRVRPITTESSAPAHEGADEVRGITGSGGRVLPLQARTGGLEAGDGNPEG